MHFMTLCFSDIYRYQKTFVQNSISNFHKLVFPEVHSMPKSQNVGRGALPLSPTRDLPSTGWFSQVCLLCLRHD